MSSAMKKGILFVSICAVAIVVLYALWPTKMIQYLTKPITAEGDSERPGMSYRAGGSFPLVIRKKMPDLPHEGELTARDGMPLVIVKKLPLEEPAISNPVAIPSPSVLSPIPATVADADSPEASSPKPEDKTLEPEAVKAEIADATTQKKKTAATAAQPQLKEKPAVHKVQEKIVPKPYSIMLASCRRPDSAQTVMVKNRRKGLTPYVVRVDLGKKGIWWRVFEGKYSSAAEASDIRSRYKLSQSLVTKTPYAIQIGAYASESDAAVEVRRLLQLKHSPYFIPARQNKQRLLVGAFATQKGARLLADELTARGISNQIVKR